MSGSKGRLVSAALALVSALVIPAVMTLGTPKAAAASDEDWLGIVNAYRAMAGQSPVTEDPNLSSGDYLHSCYMTLNGITHFENAALPGYTTAGDLAGQHSNVAVSSGLGATARSHIDLWMTGPFHAIGVLRYNLQTVGFAKCDNPSTPTWHSAASLNVLDGMNHSIPRPSSPILFPGNGTTTNLTRFVTESPDPRSFCTGYAAPGLPVIAMMPEAYTSVSASITGPNGAIPSCALSSLNTTGDAKALLAYDNAVTVLPNAPLVNGVYTVTVTTNVRTVTWSFTVDTGATLGSSAVEPLPTATALHAGSNYTSIIPFRLVDTRIRLRATKLVARTPKRLQIAGNAKIPGNITALAANFTISDSATNGFLTVYDCSGAPPTASTVNFGAGTLTSNAGVFPLGAHGELCLYTNATAHFSIDVYGYFLTTSTLSYQGITPTPLIDTVSRLRAPGRLPARRTISANLWASGITPVGAAAVAVNITGLWPSKNGYLTAYNCGRRPLVTNVNPTVGTTKSNFAIVPLSPAGLMCLYSLTAVDVKVDVLGYFMRGLPHAMIPSTPTRVVDTRDANRPPMNFGNGGDMVPANVTQTITLAGQRGIPANATDVSINIVAVAPSAAGSLTVWDCGAMPSTRAITFPAGTNVANAMQARLSPTGTLCVSSTAATHIVIDVTGWWI
jgi:hypothetical protein